MREILFRAKEVGANKWVYGYYAMRSEESPVPETNEWYCEHYILIDKGINGFEEVLIDIKTLGQYTGVKDKEGTMLFEGDKFQFMAHKGYLYPDFDGLIKFQYCSFGFISEVSGFPIFRAFTEIDELERDFLKHITIIK